LRVPVDLRVFCWNLFHGRDAPPNPRLFKLRSRLFRVTEDDGTYVQANRSLLPEFASLIAGEDWSLCLLQEVPPTWAEPLAERSGAQHFLALTSRNQFAAITRPLARWNPDLLASWEGGSNLALVRPPWRIVPGSCRSLTLSPPRERGLRERRRMGFARLRLETDGEKVIELCATNLHADSGPRGAREVWQAARLAVGWSAGAPLVFGGDFNQRPRSSSVFEQLARELGLAAPTGPDAIDHILARGLETVEPSSAWPPERRDLEIFVHGERRLMRLSDHTPVEASFRFSDMRY
jgi:endonuclease/exonuclease/phosphatase family metal-dependent hydrolase